MEGRLTIFLACVAITLFVNTVIIWLVFKVFGDLAAKVTEATHEFQTGASTRQTLATLQSVSENAAKVTGDVRDQLAAFGPALERMQVEHSDRLAKADVRLKLVFRAIHFSAETIDRVVNWPFRHFQTASAVIKGVAAFIRGTESGPDARPRR